MGIETIFTTMLSTIPKKKKKMKQKKKEKVPVIDKNK